MTAALSFFELGSVFQSKLLAALIRKPKYLQQVKDIMHPEYFSSDAAKWIFKEVCKYNQTYKTSPPAEFFKHKLEELDLEVLKVAIRQELKEVYKYYDSEDLPYTEDVARKSLS